MTENKIANKNDMLELLVTTLTALNNCFKGDDNYQKYTSDLKVLSKYFFPEYNSKCNSCSEGQIKIMLGEYWVKTGKAEYENINS